MAVIGIAEDDFAIRALIEGICSAARLPYRLYYFGNGIEVCDFILQHPEMNRVVTDLSMPKMNGLELIDWIRRNRPNIKIALMSGGDENRLQRQAAELGVLYLKKPFLPGEFLALINQLTREDAL